MTVTVKHPFISPKTDDLDATNVRPSNWNEAHTVTMATNKLLGRGTAADGPVEEITLGSNLSFSGSTLNAVAGADGDRGDITVSGAGTVWTIDPHAVTWAKLQQPTAPSVLIGRGAGAGVGDTQEITIGTGLTMSGTTLTSSGEAVFTTGDVKLTFKTVADAGWIIADDGTIGDATSGATTRANADTQALYVLFWTNMSNMWCPTPGGRGASALADFNAHKTLRIPQAVGRSIALAGAGAGLTSRQLGGYLGAETETQTEAKLASHNHGLTMMNASPADFSLMLSTPGSGVDTVRYAQYTGFSSPLNIVDPTVYMNVMVKL